jgi:hypothetical protein
VLLLTGSCASAPVQKQLADGNIHAEIEKLLQKGSIVNILVEYKSSFTAIPAGCKPENFNCTADTGTMKDTENYLLLSTFAKFPNFSLVDRSLINSAMKEIDLGLNGVTASQLQPGKLLGATHLLFIDGKNHVTFSRGKYTDTYTEIRKLLDLQKDTVIAMEKVSETHSVEFIAYRQQKRTFVAPTTVYQSQQSRPVQKIPDWQLARMLKQRFINLRNEDDAVVISRFIKNHPWFKDKIMITGRQ